MIGRADIEGSKSNVAMNALAAASQLSLCRIPLVRTSSELAVQCEGSISSSPPIAYVFGTGTPMPSPQSQSFSRSYGSILPTSLAYIVSSTRGCSSWRPDAVMSTTERGLHSVLQIFKGHRERTGHHATCGALPTAGPYLRRSRFQGGLAVKQKRQLFLWLPPTSPDFLTLPSTATSRFRNFNLIPFRSTREMRCLSGFPRPLGLTNPYASAVHMEPFPSSAFKVFIRIFATTTKICTDGRSARARAQGFAATAAPSYSSGLAFAPMAGSLDGIDRLIWAAFPNNPTRRHRLMVRKVPGTTGLSPSLAPPSRGLGPDPPLTMALQTIIRTTEPPDSKAGLFPVHSPLLRESLPLLADHDIAQQSDGCVGREGGLSIRPAHEIRGAKGDRQNLIMHAAQETDLEQAYIALAPRLRWQTGQDVAARAGMQPNSTCRTRLTRRALLPMRTLQG
ncbi:hypothetical protein CQW23_33278 [Capsicum baccatum]|uniref:Protein TAR1 n=1 Tax=Capsicum baccatum TaxID=33114 RepID=A0A2G2V2E3_CAPBA|nr:hypothetical protein CQW23_33278 [Capsicum baccatum]